MKVSSGKVGAMVKNFTRRDYPRNEVFKPLQVKANLELPEL